MQWIEYKNNLPINTVKAWREQILSIAEFKPVGWTGNPLEPYRHWACYPEKSGVYSSIFDCLNEFFKDDGFNLKLDRLILNMYDHGDSSWLHEDSKENNAWTCLLFLNEFWNINWGGDFVLVENDDIIYSTIATPGKFILFKSDIHHAARPVSREAAFPRMALAMQCTNHSKIETL